MIRGNERRRGLALLTTLILLGLLLALVAAFLNISQAGNRFTLGSLERAQAQDVCVAALDYVRFQVEKERSWGDDINPVSGVEMYPYSDPKLRMELVQSGKVVTVNGSYSPSGNFATPLATFVMTVENNLKTRATLPGANGPVPPRSVRVGVRATAGAVNRDLAAVLRPVPITKDSLSAGRNAYLDEASLVRVESRDIYANQIQAGQDLNLPNDSNVQFLGYGIGTSAGQLNLGGENLAAASDARVRQAGATSGGIYMPSQTAPEILPFDITKITLPNHSTNVAAGTWKFGDIVNEEYIPHHVNYQTPPPPGGFGGGGTDSCTRYQKKTSLYNQLTSPTGQMWVAGTAIAGSEVLDPPYDPLNMYSSEGAAEGYGYDDDSGATNVAGASDVHTIAPGFRVNVTTAQMAVLPEYRLQVAGDFIVDSTGTRKPEMYFGYDLTVGGVATQTGLNDGIEAAQNDPGKYMAAITADGDVNVTGGVIGYGSMIAGGQLTIKASSGLRAAPDLGVVVKGRRIVIDPASEPEPSFPGEPVDADYPIFRDSIQAVTNGDWSQYNIWLDHDQAIRGAMLGDLVGESTGSDAATLWNTLCSQIGSTLSPPNFVAQGWPPGPVTVGQYVRMKEFLQTRASRYNGGNGDPSWLNLSARTEDSNGRVAAILNGIAQWARSYKQSFQQYLTTPDQGPPDMFLAGLVYADEDLIINANGKSVRTEGAVLARTGDVTIVDPTRVDLVYNRTLLDDITASGDTGKVELEKVFVTID